MDSRDLFLQHIAPGLGCIMAFVMFLSPLSAVRSARSKKTLGNFNPLPLVAVIANCIAWIIYACIIRNPYVIGSNQPGLLLGVYMTVCSYGLAEDKVKDQMLAAIMFFTVVLSSAGIAICFLLQDVASQASAAGYLSVFVLLCYYSAPLSTLGHVLRARCSASLHAPLSATSCVNGALWVAYGLATANPFIYLPNMVGFLFGVLQLLCILVFPPSRPPTDEGSKAAVTGSCCHSSPTDAEEGVSEPLLASAT